ncbi:hypothetical protein EC957_009339 [Mortierella hygrophila]|uniref:Uncharacterized protein n=1 Tax=Mortierella hygrophila TaxID=979708 RepID=A0A9P6EVM8_9FUNG|nr:hypothetical protein EC957_009339 [Mortierella hygrophila]
MTVDDSVMQKLWKLTNELTAQLVFNRNATLELKQQLADLQAKTAQGSVSVAQDITMFSNQEHADVSLRIANERLMEENAQLQEQVREYERWMEFIMTKFRLQNFAMAQSRKEAMQEAYRMSEQEGELALRLQEENAVLQARLVDVGAVARKAINEEYYNTESAIETLELENQGLREMLGIAADHRSPIAVRDPGNRVSFPSTGSYVASSGSDQERRQGHGRNASFSPVDQSTSALGASEWSALSTAPEVEPYMVTFDTSRTNTASNSKVASPLLESTKDFSEPEPALALDTQRAATTTATATATTTTASPVKKKTADTTTKTSTANTNNNTSLARSTSGANTNASSNNSTTKGGMMINTGVATKKNVTNSSHPPISNSSALKNKKTQRKQKA